MKLYFMCLSENGEETANTAGHNIDRFIWANDPDEAFDMWVYHEDIEGTDLSPDDYYVYEVPLTPPTGPTLLGWRSDELPRVDAPRQVARRALGLKSRSPWP